MRKLYVIASLLVACGSKKAVDPALGAQGLPQIIRSVPTNGTLGVNAAVAIELEFDQGVAVTGDWFVLSCDSGSAGATSLPFTGGPKIWKLPALGLPPGEVCFLNVIGKGVKGLDTGESPAGDTSIAFLVKGTAPSAVNDLFTADRRRGLQSDDGALLVNDNRGDFAAQVVSFGGGDVSASEDDTAAGSVANIGSDGAMLVTATGQLVILPPTDSTDDIHFTYKIANYDGVATADVVVHVVESAAPVRDDGYVAIDGQTLTVNAAGGVLTNDALGIPAATFRGFAGGDLGADVEHVADDTVTFANGSLTMHADGSFEMTPNAGFHGVIRWFYAVQNTGGVFSAEVVVVVPQRPTATADHYTDLVVNTPVAVGASGPSGPRVSIPSTSVLANDTVGGGQGPLSVVAGTFSTTQGGSVDLQSTGIFVYRPPLDFIGDDTFTYLVSDGFLSALGTVTLTINSPRVLYVSPSAGAGGNGSSSAPFQTIAGAIAAAPADVAPAGRTIVLLDSVVHAVAVDLPPRMALLGRGADTVVAAGASQRTILAKAATSTVQQLQIHDSNRVRGVSVVYTGAGLAVTAPSTTNGLDLDLDGITCASCSGAFELTTDVGSGNVRIRGMTVASSGIAVQANRFTGKIELAPSAPTDPALSITSADIGVHITGTTEVVANKVTINTTARSISLDEVNAVTVSDATLAGGDSAVYWHCADSASCTLSVQQSTLSTTTGAALLLVQQSNVPLQTSTIVIANNTVTGSQRSLQFMTSNNCVATVDVHDNSFTNSAGEEFLLDGSGNAVTHLTGYAGAVNDGAAIGLYLAARNATLPISGTVAFVDTATFGL